MLRVRDNPLFLKSFELCLKTKHLLDGLQKVSIFFKTINFSNTLTKILNQIPADLEVSLNYNNPSIIKHLKATEVVFDVENSSLINCIIF
jgi:hypothetical protein